MIARKYRRLGRPPGRTGKAGTRPRTTKGGGRHASGKRRGCCFVLVLAAGLALLVAGSAGWLRWNAAFTAPLLLAALTVLFTLGQLLGARKRVTR